MFDELEKCLEEIESENFEKVDKMHHYTSGFKSIQTKDSYEGMERLRQAIGGAGFSAWSNMPNLVQDWAPAVTFEGDNTVMA